MVQRVLNMATEDSDNPDLRDRGYVYWRLLSTNPDAAKAVVLADKPSIADDTFQLDSQLLTNLIQQIGSVASIYHKPADAFVKNKKRAKADDDDEDDDDEEEEEEEEEEEGGGGGGAAAPAPAAPAAGPVDLLDMSFDAPAPAPAAPAAPSPAALENDFFGGGGDLMSAAPAAPVEPPKPQLVAAEQQGWGVKTDGLFAREGGQIVLKMDFTNTLQPTPTSQIALQLNKSSFGIFPAQAQVNFSPPLGQGSRQSHSLPMTINPSHVSTGAPNLNVQVGAWLPACPPARVQRFPGRRLLLRLRCCVSSPPPSLGFAPVGPRGGCGGL
jgi:AP-1 complex subunit beta-1